MYTLGSVTQKFILMSNQEQLLEAKKIDSVTDYVEEKDDANLTSGVSSIVATTRTENTPVIKISREDILLIADELEIGKDEAEKILAKHAGNAKAALASFVDGV